MGEARRPQRTAGALAHPSHRAAPGEGGPCVHPHSSTQSPGKGSRQAAGTWKLFIGHFSQQAAGAWCGGGRALGVVLQVGFLLGLHLQDALHVVLVSELRGAPAECDHSLHPRQTDRL